jgi:hypothetical protein
METYSRVTSGGKPPSRPNPLRLGLTQIGPSLILGALVVYLSFRAGGFYREGTTTAALILAAALLLRIGFAEDPFRGYGRWLFAGAVPLALLGGWTLASLIWSDSPGRAVDESNRVLLYLLALAFFGSFSWSSTRARWLVRAYALAITAVCLAAFLSRALPELVGAPAGFVPARLSFPVTYWNTLGLMAALGLLLCVSMAGDERESPVPRAVAAAATPVLGATLLLTFSRGAIGVAVLGLVLYVVLAHARGLVTGLLAVVPFTAFAVIETYQADLLATANPTSPAAVSQGHGLAELVLVCSLGAALLRLALLPIDRRLRQVALAPRQRRGVLAAGLAVLIIGALLGAIAVNLPRQVDVQYAEFVRGGATQGADKKTRERLASLSNNGRLENWRVARASFRADPEIGQGAGSFETEWAQRRPIKFHVLDAHSLYLETAAELGIVGLLLLAATLISVAAALARAAKGQNRAPWVALLCCAVVWLVRAGVDWDWEMPAVSLGFFAAGGLALAARREGEPLRAPRPVARVLVSVGLLVLMVLPAGAWLADRSLDRAARDFNRGHCSTAIASALDATVFLNAYPEPYEILAYCDARLGAEPLAVRMMRTAAARDPNNWRYQYGLAIVRGVARLDPRPAADRALRLNPLSERVRGLAEKLSATQSPAKWERLARGARLPGR